MNRRMKRMVSILMSMAVSFSSLSSAVAKQESATIPYGSLYQFPIFMIDGKKPDTIETII